MVDGSVILMEMMVPSSGRSQGAALNQQNHNGHFCRKKKKNAIGPNEQLISMNIY